MRVTEGHGPASPGPRRASTESSPLPPMDRPLGPRQPDKRHAAYESIFGRPNPANPPPPSPPGPSSSAMSYPPALALAREDIIYSGRPVPKGREPFAELYADRLAHHLARQHKAPYVLAEATACCLIGGLFVGQYAWVVGYDPERRVVGWVTSDYFIYTDPASGFALSPNQLERLAV